MAESRAGPNGSHAAGERGSARRAFLAWVDAANEPGRLFLELCIRLSSPGRYEIRHRSDATVPMERLQRYADPEDARRIAQTDALGEHRPLRTAPDLRRGWALWGLDADGLFTAVDYLYPAAIPHWHAGRSGTLRVTPWSRTAARQSGIHSAVGLLPADAVRLTVEACCADEVCLRSVSWGLDENTPAPVPPAAVPESGLPCPEACSLFISLARKVLALEREPRRHVEGLGELNASELDQIRRLVLALPEGGPDTVRQGDFEDPLNRRRLRYLAARLRNADREDDGQS